MGQARPNKNTLAMQVHCRSIVPEGHSIFTICDRIDHRKPGSTLKTHTRRALSPSNQKSLRCAARSSRTPEAIFLFLRVYRPPIRMASTAFWACRRFSVSSKISSAWRSKVSTAISSPLRAGRQCSTMQSGLARASSSSFT